MAQGSLSKTRMSYVIWELLIFNIWTKYTSFNARVRYWECKIFLKCQLYPYVEILRLLDLRGDVCVFIHPQEAMVCAVLHGFDYAGSYIINIYVQCHAELFNVLVNVLVFQAHTHSLVHFGFGWLDKNAYTRRIITTQWPVSVSEYWQIIHCDDTLFILWTVQVLRPEHL